MMQTPSGILTVKETLSVDRERVTCEATAVEWFASEYHYSVEQST